LVQKEIINSIIDKFKLTRVSSKFNGDKNIMSYLNAINIVHMLEIKSRKEWEGFMMDYKINELPRRPDIFYNEWVNWSEWLGMKCNFEKKIATFENSIEIVKSLGLKSKGEYSKNYKKSDELPSNPPIFYGELWTDWSHFLSKIPKPRTEIIYLEYSKAKDIINSWNLKSQKEWHLMSKEGLIPIDIPRTPHEFYDEWISWNEWLGHNKTRFKEILSYSEAKDYLRKEKLTSTLEYMDFVITNNINFLSLSPYAYYGDEFISIYDYLNIDINSSNISYGEKKIFKYLETNKIIFKREYRFKDCFNKLPLPFDFFIESKNICIEFDGEQHFKPIKYFGGIDAYIIRKKNDIIKNEYCRNKKIKLIRISYEDINIIEEILSNEIIVNV
jgi:hypothetical protein